MSWSTLIIILIAALILYIALKFVTGILKLGISIALLAILCFGCYWLYMQATGNPVSFNDMIPFLK